MIKDIPGFEERYAVTEDGRVWSYEKQATLINGGVRTFHAKWLKPFYRGHKGRQYQIVELDDGKAYSIHRLVAITYIPNPHQLPQINHIDGNKYNNCVSNLEWCDQIYNSRHAQDTGLNKQFYGEEHGGHKLSTEQVKEIREKKTQGMTLKQLSEEYGSCISNISYIVRGETRNYG